MWLSILSFIIGGLASYFIVPYLGIVKKEDIKNFNFKDYKKMKVFVLFFAWFIIAIVIGGVLASFL